MKGPWDSVKKWSREVVVTDEIVRQLTVLGQALKPLATVRLYKGDYYRDRRSRAELSFSVRVTYGRPALLYHLIGPTGAEYGLEIQPTHPVEQLPDGFRDQLTPILLIACQAAGITYVSQKPIHVKRRSPKQ